MNAVSAVIIIRFENKHRSMSADEFEQIDRLPVAHGLSIGNTSRPRYCTTYCFLFTRCEPILALFVRKHLEHRFLMHDLASERIYETNVVIHICADEWVRIVMAREEFVDDDPFINEID